MSSPSTERDGAGEADAGDVAEAVVAWRRREGLSLERAGALLEVAATTVRDWERGRSPRPWHLRRLALLQVLPAGGREPTDPSCDADPALVLAAVRAELGLTLASIARLAGCSPSSVSRWERGSRVPSRAALERLARHPRLAGAPQRHLQALLGAAAAGPVGAAGVVSDEASKTVRGPSPLRELRRSRGLPLALAASEAKVSRSRLRQAEAGTRPLPLAAVRRLALLYARPVAEVAAVAGCPAPRHLVSAPVPGGAVHLRLAEALAWSGRTCVDLAGELGVSAGTVRRWCRGEQRPTLLHARAVERALGLPPRAISYRC